VAYKKKGDNLPTKIPIRLFCCVFERIPNIIYFVALAVSLDRNLFSL